MQEISQFHCQYLIFQVGNVSDEQYLGEFFKQDLTSCQRKEKFVTKSAYLRASYLNTVSVFVLNGMLFAMFVMKTFPVVRKCCIKRHLHTYSWS
jgi:hypothetical protein